MRVLFISQPGAFVDRLVLALKLRWSDLDSAVVSRSTVVAEAIEREDPDLVLICQALSGMSVYDAIETARNVTDAPIMVVLEDDDAGDATRTIRSLEMGADDYVAMPVDLMEVMARAVALDRRARITRRRADEDGPVVCGSLTIIPASYEAFVGTNQLDLTPTEFRLLYLLASNSGSIMTRDAIRRVLWINDFYCSDALKKYVQRLRRKLGDDARNPTWIKTVHGIGYMMATM